MTIPVYAEELVVGKREEKMVNVHLHKNIVEEQVSVPVTLRHEEVTTERIPVTGQAKPATTDGAFKNIDIDVPVMGEEAIVGKALR